MEIPTFRLLDWDNSKRPFFNEYVTHIPAQFYDVITDLIMNPCGDIIPALTSFLLSFDNIVALAAEKDAYYLHANLIKFISLFAERVIRPLDDCPVTIPSYNLYHYGNICHVNVCINILSSLNYLIEAMGVIEHPSEPFNIVRQYIMNSLSEVDLTPDIVYDLVQILQVNIQCLEECEETFKKILRIIHHHVGRGIIFYWDSSYEFVDKEDANLSLPDLLKKYRPVYFVVNAQEFNVINDVETNTRVPLDYEGYGLSSFIVARPAHFVSAFRVNGTSELIVKDDVRHRYQVSRASMTKIRNPIVLACYVATSYEFDDGDESVQFMS